VSYYRKQKNILIRRGLNMDTYIFDIVATAIKFGGTVEDLRELEFSYVPLFTTAKDM